MICEEIKTLYRVFARYPRPTRLEGCPCCTDAETSRLLETRPLHALTADELSHYAFKAMTTWGDLDEFRYFLPRIFELTAFDALHCDTEVVLGKLGYAGWTDWPADEQEAIWAYVEALWVQCVRANDIWQADGIICGFSSSASDVSLLLKAADEVAPNFRADYLNECGRGDKRILTNAFWAQSLPSYQQVLDWAYSSTPK